MTNKKLIYSFVIFLIYSSFSLLYFYLIKHGYDNLIVQRSYFLAATLAMLFFCIYGDLGFFDMIEIPKHILYFIAHQLAILVLYMLDYFVAQKYIVPMAVKIQGGLISTICLLNAIVFALITALLLIVLSKKFRVITETGERIFLVTRQKNTNFLRIYFFILLPICLFGFFIYAYYLTSLESNHKGINLVDLMALCILIGILIIIILSSKKLIPKNKNNFSERVSYIVLGINILVFILLLIIFLFEKFHFNMLKI